jgi:hypothetical protein
MRDWEDIPALRAVALRKARRLMIGKVELRVRFRGWTKANGRLCARRFAVEEGLLDSDLAALVWRPDGISFCCIHPDFYFYLVLSLLLSFCDFFPADFECFFFLVFCFPRVG